MKKQLVSCAIMGVLLTGCKPEENKTEPVSNDAPVVEVSEPEIPDPVLPVAHQESVQNITDLVATQLTLPETFYDNVLLLFMENFQKKGSPDFLYQAHRSARQAAASVFNEEEQFFLRLHAQSRFNQMEMYGLDYPKILRKELEKSGQLLSNEFPGLQSTDYAVALRFRYDSTLVQAYDFLNRKGYFDVNLAFQVTRKALFATSEPHERIVFERQAALRRKQFVRQGDLFMPLLQCEVQFMQQILTQKPAALKPSVQHQR